MKKNTENLLLESVVFLAAELYNDLYNADIEGVSEDAHSTSDKIIELARSFELELAWQENDERNYFEELDKYVLKVRHELLPTPLETVTKKHEEYLTKHKREPAYAEADIQWKDSGEVCEGYVFNFPVIETNQLTIRSSLTVRIFRILSVW